MGHIYAVCGPSGAGKTSIISAFMCLRPPNIRLLSRTTTRPPRSGEVAGKDGYAEYEFVDYETFVKALSANEFVEHTEYNGHLYGIPDHLISETLRSQADGLIMSGTSGAISLKQEYPNSVSIVYIYPGEPNDIMQPYSLALDSTPNQELIRRLYEKIARGQMKPTGDIATYVERRMKLSLLGVAHISGQMRLGLEVNVINNERDKLMKSADQLNQLRTKTALMCDIASQSEAVPQSPYEFGGTLPKKRVGATVLFFNQANEILLVKPTYRDDWLTPGGTAELNESPSQACKREVSEELGLDLPIGRILCIEYQSSHDHRVENIQFIFFGGTLTEDVVKSIRLPLDEITGFKFCELSMAAKFLNYKLHRRVKHAVIALRKGQVVYLENGVVLS